MITKENLFQYETELYGTPIYLKDFESIVYRDDQGAVTEEKPQDGDTPYFKNPLGDYWIRIKEKTED